MSEQTSEQVRHTAVPWCAVKYPDCKTWTVAADTSIASKIGRESDARFIVQAVNSHDALVEALRAALVLCNALGREDSTIAYDGKSDFCVTDKLLAALALAKGGSSEH